MHFDLRPVRIVALCTYLLLLTWGIRSNPPTSVFPYFKRKAQAKSEVIPEQEQLMGDTRTALSNTYHPTTSRPHHSKNLHAHHLTSSQTSQPTKLRIDQLVDELTTTTTVSIIRSTTSSAVVSKGLGLNGRPKLPVQPEAQYPSPSDDGSGLDTLHIQFYVDSILDIENAKFWRMNCEGQDQPRPRYEVLQNIAMEDPGIKYLFALDLVNVIEILPRLMSSILQTIKYLGIEHCAISIIEGRSFDGTYLVLHELRQHFDDLGIQYWLHRSNIDPNEEGKDRIAELSKLRNLALDPLRTKPGDFSETPLIFFINDIAVCPDDLLEMLYQHLLQDATQTCAFDWVEGGELFYDCWVSRSMSGNTFFELPQDMTWAFSRNLFWDEPISKDKYDMKQPLQVFSCWGGMTVINAEPFQNGQLEFRRNDEGECYGGEPQFLGSDLVKLNMSRVQAIPYINVAYSNHEGQMTKDKHGYVPEFVNVTKAIGAFEEDDVTERIRWRKPPPRYRCMPTFIEEWWVNSIFVPGEQESYL